MAKQASSVLICVASAVLWGGSARAEVDFATDVAPIIREHCVRCHNANQSKGEVSFETVEGFEASSLGETAGDRAAFLLDLVRFGPNGAPPEMPKEGDPLSSEEVAVLEAWLNSGAPWPEGVRIVEASKAGQDWWAFQPLEEGAPPSVEAASGRWLENSIDRFIVGALAERGLAPNPEASRRDWLRRATYDMTGLPPTPEELADFVEDRAADAYEKVVTRLLSSPRYGERWGRHWLDVMRFGESRGFERNEIIRNLWPFRDYVIKSFNQDKPFNQFIRECLAGDVIGAGEPDVEIGAAFLVSGPYDDVGNQDPKQAAQIRANTIDEVIRATSETFLGLTVGCARCHAHKFDPIAQEDYYRWYGVFAGVRHGSRTVATQEARDADAQARAPLNEARASLQKQRDAINQSIRQRGAEVSEAMRALATREPVDRKGTEEQFEPVEAIAVRLVVEGTESNPAGRAGYTIEELQIWTAGEDPANVAHLENGARAEGSSRVADDFADAYSPELTIDGRYGARWLAAGPILTVHLAAPALIDRVWFSSDRNGDAGAHGVARFVSEYRIEVSSDGENWTQVADSYDRRALTEAHHERRVREATITDEERSEYARLGREIQEVDAQLRALPALPNWWVGTPSQVKGPFPVFLGGAPDRPGTPVLPGSLSTLEGLLPSFELADDSSEGERRRALADWVASDENALTLRVLANRVWQYHFGVGLVSTSSDFGYMGEEPTHPELLDWLAITLRDAGWRLKPLHREILLSQTYRQSSEFREEAARIDGSSRYLWRFPPRRLEAEALRDTALFVSGVLDERMGGAGFRLYQYMQDNVATYEPLDRFGPETYRRSVYHHNARAATIDLLTDFDCPDSAFGAPRRAVTTTPLQALTMLNHSFTTDMAKAFAARLASETGDQIELVERAFILSFAREPNEDETRRCVDFINEHGTDAFARVLLNSNELLTIH